MTKAANDKVTRQFKYLRGTPGTHLMQEVDDQGNELNAKNGGLVCSMYLRKDQMPNGEPKKMIVTMEFIY